MPCSAPILLRSRLGGGHDATPPAPAEFRDAFLNLCDAACKEFAKEITPFEEKHRTVVEPETHHAPFFEDAYGVRALAVAYDITGKPEYLSACQHWANRVITLQEKMTPKGAYYLNYGRPPGATSGDWWVADSGSVAMGILATAARTTDQTDKDRYLDSVKSFAQLVLDHYIAKDGGVTDGLWSHYDGPWWCSTATFSAAAYLLYDQTGDPRYLKVARDGTDWLVAHDFRRNDPPAWDVMGGMPGVVFYIGESHAIALGHHLPDDRPTEGHRRAGGPNEPVDEGPSARPRGEERLGLPPRRDLHVRAALPDVRLRT